MPSITIDGIRPWDGSYPLNLADEPLTTREWGWIKRLAGYVPLTVDTEALSDPELVTVFATVALRRAGKIETDDVQDVFETMIDAPYGSKITLAGDDQEEAEEENPPPSSSNSNDATSGPDSRTSLETSQPSREHSGTVDSATSGLHRVRSAS